MRRAVISLSRDHNDIRKYWNKVKIEKVPIKANGETYLIVCFTLQTDYKGHFGGTLAYSELTIFRRDRTVLYSSEDEHSLIQCSSTEFKVGDFNRDGLPEIAHHYGAWDNCSAILHFAGKRINRRIYKLMSHC